MVSEASSVTSSPSSSKKPSSRATMLGNSVVVFSFGRSTLIGFLSCACIGAATDNAARIATQPSSVPSLPDGVFIALLPSLPEDQRRLAAAEAASIGCSGRSAPILEVPFDLRKRPGTAEVIESAYRDTVVRLFAAAVAAVAEAPRRPR